MKYIYNPKSVVFRKTDSNGDVFCQTNAGAQLVLNDIGGEVLSYIDKYSDTSEIVNLLSQEYPEVAKDVLASDLNEIFRIMDLFGIVEIEPEPLSCDDVNDRFTYKMCGDSNYKQVSKFIINEFRANSLHYCGNINNEHYFDTIALRYRVMDNYEYGVFAVHDGQIVGYLAAMPPKMDSTVMQVTTIFLKNEISYLDKITLIDNLLTKMYDTVAKRKKVFKIRISVTLGFHDSRIIDLVENCGFSKEFTLENETILGEGSIVFYYKECLPK